MPKERLGSVFIPSKGIVLSTIILEVLKYVPSPPSDIINDLPIVSETVRGHSCETVNLSTLVFKTSSNLSLISK